MLVVNFAAGPGAGKSTTAAGVFYFLKLAGVRCELVDEYAKQLTYDGDFSEAGRLQDQVYVLSKQRRKLDRLARDRKVQVVVTDSPLFLSCAYNPYNPREWFDGIAWKLFRDFDNLVYFIDRTKPYAQYGRSQDEAGARQKDEEIRELMRDNVAYKTVRDSPALALKVAQEIFAMKYWVWPSWMNAIHMPEERDGVSS